MAGSAEVGSNSGCEGVGVLSRSPSGKEPATGRGEGVGWIDEPLLLPMPGSGVAGGLLVPG